MSIISNKYSAMKRAGGVSGAMSSAAGHCSAAKAAVASAVSEVEANWKSDSGTAMINKLESLMKQIDNAREKYEAASIQAAADGNSVYARWPEPPVVEEDE